jgi:hypothetical protein
MAEETNVEGQEGGSILETMTFVLKTYKLILSELELQYHALSECSYSPEHTVKLDKL